MMRNFLQDEKTSHLANYALLIQTLKKNPDTLSKKDVELMQLIINGTNENDLLSLVSNDFMLFSNYPMPPSINASRTVARGRIINTKESRQFKSDFALRCKYHDEFSELKKRCHAWVKDGLLLKTTAIFHFKTIFTKAGTPRKVDLTNREKSFHDALSEALEIDDSYIFRSELIKAPSEIESISFKIEPIKNEFS